MILPTITGVSIASPPVVSFRLTDSSGNFLQGLAPGSIRFTLNKLVPGTGGGSSEWVSYINVSRNPAVGSTAGVDWGTEAALQATAQTATAGTFTDNGDGTYTYQFSFDIANVTTPVAVPYDPTLTHRVCLQIGGSVPADNNACFDWQPSTGATTGLFTREIVDNDTCNACHDGLAFHGGGRRDTQYCVACHNPGSTDPESTNTVDMAAMIHNIHAGAEGGKLPYFIVGFNNTPHDYSGVRWSQDIRNCQTCHEESDTDTPDASNWRQTVNAASCGTCHHSDVDFTTGANHGRNQAVGPATDDQCLTCHGPNTTLFPEFKVESAHQVPTAIEGQKFAFNVLSVTNTAPGQFPVVTFSVTDPTNADAPYNIQTDGPFTVCAGGASRLAVILAWNTADYTNAGSGASPAQPVSMNPLTACGGSSVDNLDGTFTVTSPVAVPAGQMGTLVAALEGHPAVDVDPDVAGAERIAVTNDWMYAAITGSVVERRQQVLIEKCNDCHNQLSVHGNNRTDAPEVCVTCHNPGATDINRRAGGCLTNLGPDDVSVDMKYMIHALHAAGATGVPYEVCGFGNSTNVFEFPYVGKLNNCEGCHATDGYYPVDSTKVLGTTVDANGPGFFDDAVTSPNAAVCTTCHTSGTARAHIEQNGGFFERIQVKNDATGLMLPGGDIETCALCHGPGKSVDLRDAHGIAAFEVFNVVD